jgi:hypothetical protein
MRDFPKRPIQIEQGDQVMVKLDHMLYAVTTKRFKRCPVNLLNPRIPVG